MNNIEMMRRAIFNCYRREGMEGECEPWLFEISKDEVQRVYDYLVLTSQLMSMDSDFRRIGIKA